MNKHSLNNKRLNQMQMNPEDDEDDDPYGDEIDEYNTKNFA